MRLIDADALKENLFIKFGNQLPNGLLDEIDNAPTVDTTFREVVAYECGQKSVERQQGEWVKIFENSFTNGYVCPFCGHKIQVTEQFLPKVTQCEGCGAEMQVKEERPQGKWIEHYDNSDGFTWLTCSRCMFKAYEDDYNFCPNCGADMRKETEDEC